MSEYHLHEIVLRCVLCGRHSSVREAWLRVYNTGKCECGGSFVIAYVPKRDQE